MGQMTFIVNDDLDVKFRKAVAKKFGLKKGNMQKAYDEALNLFIKQN